MKTTRTRTEKQAHPIKLDASKLLGKKRKGPIMIGGKPVMISGKPIG
jgi:hypothetical protein